ncbi:phage tail protein [Pseudoflavonifractor sp. 524-17]|uniref:tail protein X n=1 Tax=Pseudoflavonifractor sp. 524-17 TaxID=2304577 RepID=UPI00137B196A|nr:tail protein X [Pseudoflavonifractor sp. 524-17]NCE66061.1 phage tail protein [Pseudoflavonifractor sp. 524-17]
MKTYTTVQGDMWDSIAHAQLGDTAHTDKLMNANLRYREIYIFPAGIVLNLPEPEARAGSPLPPWKGAAMG